MTPRRSDYKTRKEYRWAKKVEQRELMARPIVNAPPMKARITLAGILWFIVLVLVLVALPGHPGALEWLAIVVPTGAAIAFYRSRLCHQWGKAWDDYARRSRIKAVERGDTSLAGRWAANVVAKERQESGAVTSTRPLPSAPQPASGIAQEIEQLAQMKQAGVLSAEEFEQAKAKLLG